jgi:hypothetical protein
MVCLVVHTGLEVRGEEEMGSTQLTAFTPSLRSGALSAGCADIG